MWLGIFLVIFSLFFEAWQGGGQFPQVYLVVLAKVWCHFSYKKHLSCHIHHRKWYDIGSTTACGSNYRFLIAKWDSRLAIWLTCLGVSGCWWSTIEYPFLKSQSQGMLTKVHPIDVCVRHGDSRPQCSDGLTLLAIWNWANRNLRFLLEVLKENWHPVQGTSCPMVAMPKSMLTQWSPWMSPSEWKDHLRWAMQLDAGGPGPLMDGSDRPGSGEYPELVEAWWRDLPETWAAIDTTVGSATLELLG